MAKTLGIMFDGGSGVGEGAKAAGYIDLWGIEKNAEIAGVAQMNGHNTIVAGVEEIDPYTLPHVDTLWASPPCQAYSIARSKGLEPRFDAEIGAQVMRYVDALQPESVIIENVPPYMKSLTFQNLVTHLLNEEYWVEQGIWDAADFGVPQHRKRVILRATRKMMKDVKLATAHVGWYSAVEDLLPTFKTSQLAAWQLKILKERDILEDTLVAGSSAFKGQIPTSLKNEPAFTIKASVFKQPVRAVLVAGASTSCVARIDSEPSFTQTVTNTTHPQRIIGNGVYTLSMRGVARLQSFSDDYKLTGNNKLDGTVIGNAVPPLMAQKLLESV